MNKLAILDFILDETTVKLIKEEKRKEENLKIVQSNSPIKAKKAEPKPYPYWIRFKNRELLPQDVIGFAGTNRRLITDFHDIDEIENDKKRPPEKRLFYAPGAELDIPGNI